MSNKLPALQFYPADWRKDIGVQSLSLEDRMIWFEMLCVMHESEERGKLVLNGQPMNDETVARLVGISEKRYKKAKKNMENSNVFSVTDGIIYNRRMVKDENIRKVRKQSGSLGGNPNLMPDFGYPNLNQIDNQTNEQNPTPSSSSLFTSSNNNTGAIAPLPEAKTETLKKEKKKKEKGSAEKERKEFVPISLAELIKIFEEKNENEIKPEFLKAQAEKMYNRCMDNGWKTGKPLKPIIDIKRTVRNWILTAVEYNPALKNISMTSTELPLQLTKPTPRNN